MGTDYSRPRVDELVFHLFTRPLHPELFDTLAFRRVRRDDYTLTVRITRTGHVITWETPLALLAEVTATADQPLPSGGRVLRHRFQGERNNRFSPQPGLTYQTITQVEVLPPEIFLHVHEEIVSDGGKRGLLHNFQPHHRLALAPVGFVAVEAGRGFLSLSAFHTFPDEFTVVKTQSLIERAE